MSNSYSLFGVGCAALAASALGLAACSTPGPGAGGSFGGSAGGGTVSGGSGGSTTTVSERAPFPKIGSSNAQKAAAPNSALVLYVPWDGGAIEYSGAGGHKLTVTENTTDKTATVNMKATLLSGRNVNTTAANIPTTDLAHGVKQNPPLSNVYSTISMSNFVVGSREVQTQVLVSTDAQSLQLTDAKYGLVYVMNGNPWPVTNKNYDFGLAAYHIGNATPTAQMPTTTATYTGTFQGNGVTASSANANTLGAVYGDVSLTANFGAGTVNGAITNIRKVDTGYPGMPVESFDINIAGSITGNAYQGTAAYVGAGTSTNSSMVNGAFYGANAKETAGAVVVDGVLQTPVYDANGNKSGSTPIPMTVMGAYGARR